MTPDTESAAKRDLPFDAIRHLRQMWFTLKRCHEGKTVSVTSADLRMYSEAIDALASRPAVQQEGDQAEQRMRRALTIIANWTLPATGKFWDEEKKRPTNYEAEYGSNGARDYMRKLADQTLANAPPASAPTVEQSIALLVSALAESKGWMRDYADSIIRDAIDRRDGPDAEAIRREALEEGLLKSELPAPYMTTENGLPLFHDIQMRAYGAACAKEEKERELEEVAKMCELMHEEDRPSDYAYAIRALAAPGAWKEGA